MYLGGGLLALLPVRAMVYLGRGLLALLPVRANGVSGGRPAGTAASEGQSPQQCRNYHEASEALASSLFLARYKFCSR